MDMDKLRFTANELTHPMSRCSLPCAYYESKHHIDGDPCCWKCSPCTRYQYLPTVAECTECPQGSLPSANLTTCLPIPELYLNYRSPLAKIVMTLASLGIIFTIYTVIMFVR